MISTHDSGVLPQSSGGPPLQTGGMTIALHREEGNRVYLRAAGIILLILHLAESF